jgi:hypothetical protein
MYGRQYAEVSMSGEFIRPLFFNTLISESSSTENHQNGNKISVFALFCQNQEKRFLFLFLPPTDFLGKLSQLFSAY